MPRLVRLPASWRIRGAGRRRPPSPPATGGHCQHSQINPRPIGSYSLRIVKNHADGVAVAGAYPAHAVAEIDAVASASPLHRSDMYGERHPVALGQRHDFGARLHTRPLFGEDEFTPGKITPRLG